MKQRKIHLSLPQLIPHREGHNIPMGLDKEIIFKTFSKIIPIHVKLRYRTGNSLTEMWEWSRSLK